MNDASFWKLIALINTATLDRGDEEGAVEPLEEVSRTAPSTLRRCSLLTGRTNLPFLVLITGSWRWPAADAVLSMLLSFCLILSSTTPSFFLILCSSEDARSSTLPSTMHRSISSYRSPSSNMEVA